MDAQTSLMNAQTEVMKEQSSFEESAALAASLSAEIERARALPLVSVQYSVEETAVAEVASWLDVLTIVNAGGPMLDVELECHSFWEVGFGPSRADAGLALLPAAWPWFETWEEIPILEQSARIEGHGRILPSVTMQRESDWWYENDPEKSMFCRPWSWVKIEYKDVLGEPHAEWYQVSSWGTRKATESEASAFIETLAPLEAAGLSVGDSRETISSAYDKVEEAWERFDTELTDAWGLL